MEGQVLASSVVKGRTAAVWFFGISLLVAAAGEILRTILEAGEGEVFFGFVWVDSVPVSALVHALMALFCIVSAIGLLWLRPFGFWMFLALHVVGAASLLLWWVWGRAVTVAHDAEPAGWVPLLIGVPWYAIVFGWCYVRRANFARRGRHKTALGPSCEGVQAVKVSRTVLILGIIAIAPAGIAALAFVIFLLDLLLVRLCHIIRLW